MFPAGLAVQARQGVNVSAGCNASTELYGTVFRPTVHEEIYGFEDLPRAVREMHRNAQTGIAIVRVAGEMPEKVRTLV